MAPAPPTNENDSSDARQRIYRDLNDREGMKHNHGQPKKAPHSSTMSTTAKFLTNCAQEHRDSLQCIERNYQNRTACEPFFQAYKDCRREENEQRKEANARASKASGGWFW